MIPAWLQHSCAHGPACYGQPFMQEAHTFWARKFCHERAAVLMWHRKSLTWEVHSGAVPAMQHISFCKGFVEPAWTFMSEYFCITSLIIVITIKRHDNWCCWLQTTFYLQIRMFALYTMFSCMELTFYCSKSEHIFSPKLFICIVWHISLTIAYGDVYVDTAFMLELHCICIVNSV